MLTRVSGMSEVIACFGSAYRLAVNGVVSEFIGSIYIKGARDIVSLSNPGSNRTPVDCDKYVEVDLEITVKEQV